MPEKRSRGRPRGSDIKDQVFLRAVADLLIKTPSLKPTTAMRRILADRNDWKAASPEAALRRWQVKWKGEAETLLSEARARAARTPVSTGSSGRRSTYSGLGGAYAALQDQLQIAQRVQDMIDEPLRQLREQEAIYHRTMRGAQEPYRTVWEQLEGANSYRNLLEQAIKDIDPIGTAMKSAGLMRGPHGYY